MTVLLLLAAGSIGGGTAAFQDQPLALGVVVEEVTRDSAGEKAGIQPGDVLLSWVRAAAPPANPEEARGEIGSPFALADIEIEQAPRGEMRLSGTRNDTSSVIVPPGAWGITARLRLSEPVLSIYLRGKDLVGAKEAEKGVAVFRELAAEAVKANEWGFTAWLLVKVAERSPVRPELTKREPHARPLSERRRTGVTQCSSPRYVMPKGWRLRGRMILRRPKRLTANLTKAGTLALGRGDPDLAEQYFKRSIGLHEKLAPDSLSAAGSEWKPLRVVASATVYAELQKARHGRGDARAGLELAAFGDPSYPALTRDQSDAIPNREVRAPVRSGYALTPLPASRTEVEGIAGVSGSRAAAYLDDQATEERAKAVSPRVRYLHFASHGLLDERFPLKSASALTIPARPSEGQANELLQAWEIFEQMRIDADLVTLSACDTGLGKENGRRRARGTDASVSVCRRAERARLAVERGR